MYSCYVSSYSDHYYYCCVLWSITHHYNGGTSSQLCGPDSMGSAWCGSATIVDSEGHWEGFCCPHHHAAAKIPSAQDAFPGICQLYHLFSIGNFPLLSWAFQLFLTCWCLFVTPQPFGVYPWQVYLDPGDGLWPMPGVHWVAAPPTALSRGSFMLLMQWFPSYSIYVLGHTALEAQHSPYPSAFPTWWGGVF